MGKAEFMKLDLGSMQSVKDFAAKFAAKSIPLHLIIRISIAGNCSCWSHLLAGHVN